MGNCPDGPRATSVRERPEHDDKFHGSPALGYGPHLKLGPRLPTLPRPSCSSIPMHGRLLYTNEPNDHKEDDLPPRHIFTYGSGTTMQSPRRDRVRSAGVLRVLWRGPFGQQGFCGHPSPILTCCSSTACSSPFQVPRRHAIPHTRHGGVVRTSDPVLN